LAPTTPVGLLFTYGLVGFIAQATPLLWSFRFTNQGTEKQGCQSRVKYNILFIMSFAENIEYLAYLYWPGLLIMGIAFKEVVYDFKKISSFNWIIQLFALDTIELEHETSFCRYSSLQS